MTSANPTRRKIIFVLVVVLVIGGWLFFRTYNPYEHPYFLRCPIKTVTGYDCPGCGSQRTFHFLANFNIRDALHENVLLVIALPYLLFGFALEYMPRRPWREKLKNRFYGRIAAYIAAVVIIAWWILRNVI